MGRFKSSVAVAVMAMAVTACGPETNRLTPLNNPSLYSANQPVVERTDYVMDLSAAGDGLPASEQGRLADWFDTLQLGYGDRVSIDQASGYANPRSREDVAAITANYGLLMSEGAPVTAGSVQPGSVRVIVTRTRATVPGCPIWEEETVGAPERTATNYGCATNSNLAAMIADPNDLVHGQASDRGVEAAEYKKSVELYRNRTPSGQLGGK